MSFLERLLAIPVDERDAWVDGVLGIESPPPDRDLPRGAVPYLPCGVAEILAMVRGIPLAATDTLVDLGAGLGRVALLAHLLTGARAIGIELQADLVAAARARTEALGLPEVEFIHGDMTGHIPDGTVLFMYAPCNGASFAHLLRRIEEVAGRHRIVLCAVDVVVPEVAWLRRLPSEPSIDLFESAIRVNANRALARFRST